MRYLKKIRPGYPCVDSSLPRRVSVGIGPQAEPVISSSGSSKFA